jgi:XRE family transcriptional regulator, regulator of sulfur utilization
MPKHSPRLGGRPSGATSFDPIPATAFGQAVRELRVVRGLSQEGLALVAGVDRGFMGHLERGERQASLTVVLKIAKALGCRPSALLASVEAQLPSSYLSVD